MKDLTKIMLLLFISVHVQANDTLRVSPDGRIKSITEAVTASQDQGVILVMPGIYYENGIEIDKSLHIIGIDYPVVDGSKKAEDVFLITSDHVTIEGIQIQNLNTSYVKDLAAISINSAKNCTIRGNILNNTFFGIYLRKVRNTLVINNRIMGTAENESSSGNAVHLWYCKGIAIENNEFSKHRDGIYLEFTDSTHIVDNLSHENVRYGLHYMFSNYNSFLNNIFRSNGAGVAVMFSNHINMKKNVFEDSWGNASYGMLLKEVRDGEISRNIFTRNTVAIYGESANRLIIEDNDFTENGWAMRILGSCRDNEITGNNFIGNTFDISSNSAENPNIFKENYWSGYTGYDLDKDGLGDVPYKPVSLFSLLSERVPESIVLQRSLFVHIIDFAEKVAPALTPEHLKDNTPRMKKIKR